MIKKFQSIENLAVFQNFHWDNEVKNGNSQTQDLQDINIFYGRNYSGKTTLSRILRAVEKGYISDKYIAPRFNLLFNDATEITQENLSGHTKIVRVFNEDFCRENLKFINNPEESIDPFAILGDLNNDIEGRISEIANEIGVNEEGQITGLHSELKIANDLFQAAINSYRASFNQLEAQLNNKATGRDVGIKYKSEKFGDQNYSRPKLDRDINIVLADTYIKPSDADAATLERLLTETVNNTILPLPPSSFSFSNLATKCEEAVQKSIGQSDKVQELVQDAILNKWVKEGKKLHEEDHSKCAFCNNEISVVRWSQLEKHFDEESEKFEGLLDGLLNALDHESIAIDEYFSPNKNGFYSKFHHRFDRVQQCFEITASKYKEQLLALKEQLEARRNNLLTPQAFVKCRDYTNRLNLILSIYEDLRKQSNSYTASLTGEQAAAKKKLRLKEVADFLTTINYSSEISNIETLQAEATTTRAAKDRVNQAITDKKDLINKLENERKDESKGAEKVNQYLNNFFGHGFLSLEAIELVSTEGSKRFKFEVMRNGSKAYHLSEGEASLISFCYFMAKLDDIDTKNAKPIIWIDDPISSLDGNHIFFVYTLLKVELLEKHKFNQLFISTHNLDFLKYLKRLSGKNEANKDYSKMYLIVQRTDQQSHIALMPKYLKEFVTEFNYLFHQIYNCAKISHVNDSNYTMFYNFGNNARKFLEIYLYYKYPDGIEDKTNYKLQKFFGHEQIPVILTERINNEYSHLAGVFERGATPTEVPEMKLAAEAIIRRIQNIDGDQYNALLVSIGEPVPAMA